MPASASQSFTVLSPLELAMRAWVELYCRPQNRETNDRAWGWAIEAMQRDASIGAAWNAIAYAEWRAAQYGWHEGDGVQLLASAVSHAERATALFGKLASKTIRTTTKEAELAKLFTNTWRYMKFAVANQFFTIAHSAGVPTENSLTRRPSAAIFSASARCRTG